MEETREISALFHLIDDPDEEVFGSVSDRIISFGKGIIPNLENLWENTPVDAVQERIELLIHRLHYRDLTEEFNNWKAQPEPDLLSGAILVAKYMYPELSTTAVYAEIDKMRRNIWLELNSYLTPMEKVNVLNSIFYNYYKQKGVEISYDSPDTFLINKTLESRKLYLQFEYRSLLRLPLPVRQQRHPRPAAVLYAPGDLQHHHRRAHLTHRQS